MNFAQLMGHTDKAKQTVALVKALVDILEQHLPDETGTRVLPQLVSESGIIPDDTVFDHIDKLNKDLLELEHQVMLLQNFELAPKKGVKKAKKAE